MVDAISGLLQHAAFLSVGSIAYWESEVNILVAKTSCNVGKGILPEMLGCISGLQRYITVLFGLYALYFN